MDYMAGGLKASHDILKKCAPYKRGAPAELIFALFLFVPHNDYHQGKYTCESCISKLSHNSTQPTDNSKKVIKQNSYNNTYDD